MKTVREYLDLHRVKILDLFKSQGKDGEMPATNLHAFLRDAFKIEEIRFIREGKDYFKEDESQAHTEKIVQQYYRTTPDGKSGKFYLYRITFSFQEVEEYLEYWLNTDRTITIQYQPRLQVVEQQTKVSLAEELRESAILDNQFMDQQRIPLLREAYQKDIDHLQEMLSRVTNNAEESQQIQGRIEIYKQKLEQLQLKRTQSNPNTQAKQSQSKQSQSKPSPPKSKTEASRPRKQANLKLVFQYYARQNHLTGVKQSFQWIQHETQTINYQKLVHFLKQYQIFPEKPKAQKKLHNIYVRICSSTRDLNYNQFLQLLDKLPEILYEGQQESPEQKKEKLMTKIQAGSEKNKLFHNPFHSLEKSNFRIDSQSLKYSFKLKPLQGKLQSQVNHQLQWRRRQKAQARQQAQREKQQRQVQKLRKLMAIDPYHPLVVKNSDLLQKRSGSVPMQPIANLDNMQKFRDASFNMKAQFGIADFQQDPLKQISRRYDIKRAEAVEREESQRMSVLMNGLIERSQAKAEKFSLSPRKRQVSSKLT